ncbi:MAG: alpha/beta fold hydrolase, partial [Hymenobacter sp.]
MCSFFDSTLTSNSAIYDLGPSGAAMSELPLSAGAVMRRNNVRITGQDKPVLLLCNGFGYNQRMWDYLTPLLATQYQVIRFDHVGSGESDRQAYDATKYNHLQGYAHDVMEICQALGLHEAVLL